MAKKKKFKKLNKKQQQRAVWFVLGIVATLVSQNVYYRVVDSVNYAITDTKTEMYSFIDKHTK